MEQLELDLAQDIDNVSNVSDVSRETYSQCETIITPKYFNVQRAKHLKDINGNDPEHVLIESNRSAGKTTGILADFLRDFHAGNGKFVLQYRYGYELSSAYLLFGDILDIYPELGKEMTMKCHAGGLFYEMLIDDKSCGFTVALNNVDAVKKYAPVFRDVNRIFMDEAQTETGKYLPDEFSKYESMKKSIAKGHGKQSRFVKSYLAANPVTIMNPYYRGWKIYKRLRPETKLIRGDKWVAIFDFNESASQAVKENNASFAGTRYDRYSTESIYLYDAMAFIDHPEGVFKSAYTIISPDGSVGVRYYPKQGIFYCSEKVDKKCDIILASGGSTHGAGTIKLPKSHPAYKGLKEAYNYGMLRFDNVESKNTILEFIAESIY